jgi:hypothetical protein
MWHRFWHHYLRPWYYRKNRYWRQHPIYYIEQDNIYDNFSQQESQNNYFVNNNRFSIIIWLIIFIICFYMLSDFFDEKS